MANAPPLVIVGASYAGVQLAASARELGFAERIVIVGDEVHAPYQRLRQGTLVAAHSVNKPAEHMQSRKLIGARARPAADQLADPAFDLKTVP